MSRESRRSLHDYAVCGLVAETGIDAVFRTVCIEHRQCGSREARGDADMVVDQAIATPFQLVHYAGNKNSVGVVSGGTTAAITNYLSWCRVV